MRDALKWVAWIVGTLVVVLVAAFAWGRLRPPTPAQAEALALLQAAPPPPGRNAWAALWLLDYEVPAERIDATYAEERAGMQEWVRRQMAQSSPGAGVWEPVVAARYPKRAVVSAADRGLLCAPREDDCLAKARAGGQPLRDLLARQAGRIAQIEAINNADVLWSDLPPDTYMYTRLPAFTNTEDLLLTAAAVAFVDGRPTEALTAVCRQAASVRRLHAHTNSLVAAMVANAWMEADEHALAGMLRERPSAEPVSEACTQAFAAPAPLDVSLCAPMQYEFETIAGIGATPLHPDRDRRYAQQAYRLAIDPQGMRRLLAPAYAWACRPDVQAAALADRVLSMENAAAVRYDLFDLVANAGGVILARVGASAREQYAQYAMRNEDYAAGLRVTAWLLRTRGSAGTAAEWQEQLVRALPLLRAGGDREIRIDPDGRQLHMRYHAPHSGRSELVLPLPK
ncbi:hypothetical protein [Rhodanobacter sp. PCA2]|uniref:hypothetical protein n=1 Tax=Rhodanobacter sp. PCA2 TaxID=2006117 RepID=UPI0015E76E65|nr:hypothetical protein [Rhodanobacter sp. PCA2]